MGRQIAVSFLLSDMELLKTYFDEHKVSLWVNYKRAYFLPSEMKGATIFHLAYPGSVIRYLEKAPDLLDPSSDAIELDGGYKGTFGYDNIPCYHSGRIYLSSEKYMNIEDKWLLNEYNQLCKFMKKNAFHIEKKDYGTFYIFRNAYELISNEGLEITY